MRLTIVVALWASLCAFGGVVPTENLTPPIEASANLFSTLASNQDAATGFDIDQTGTAAGHMWHNGLWQGAPSFYSVPSSYISVDASGNIHLQWVTAFATTGCPLPTTNPGTLCPLPTISSGDRSLSTYRAFGHGYYEWVVRYTPNNTAAWGAEWLLGLTTGKNCLAQGFPTLPVSGTAPPYSEIDNEWSYNTDSTLHVTLHQTNGPGDAQCNGTTNSSGASGSVSPGDPTVFHTIGILWCGTFVGSGACGGGPGIVWYYDHSVVTSGSTTADTESQLHIVNMWMAEQCGGGQPNCGSPPSAIDMYIQSFRYWSCASWQANALGC
jgi:hypothetical protein